MKKYLIPALIAILFVQTTTHFKPYDGWIAFFVDNLRLGATSFPTSLDSFTNPSATDRTNSPSHATQHSNANDAIEALEAKVGIDGSAVTSSHDYKLSGVTGSDLACSLTGTETLTNKTLTAPNMTSLVATTSIFNGTTTIEDELDINASTSIDVGSDNFTLNLGSDAAGDIYYRNTSGYLTRLGVGSAGEVLKVSGGLPTWDSDNAGVSVLMRAVATTTQALTTSPAVINFGGVDFDTGSDYDGINTYTAPATGYYDIASRLSFTAQVGGFYNQFIYVNGAASSTAKMENAAFDMSIRDILYLQSGDTVNIYADYDNTGATVNSGTTTSYFTVIQL